MSDKKKLRERKGGQSKILRCAQNDSEGLRRQRTLGDSEGLWMTDAMSFRLATLNENARSVLDCGGPAPPWNNAEEDD